ARALRNLTDESGFYKPDTWKTYCHHCRNPPSRPSMVSLVLAVLAGHHVVVIPDPCRRNPLPWTFPPNSASSVSPQRVAARKWMGRRPWRKRVLMTCYYFYRF
ncbi:hypothetical protein FOZ63_020939, partial [Perkinsus olseni]